MTASPRHHAARHRHAFWLLALVAAAFGLAACSGSAEPDRPVDDEPAVVEPAPEAADEPVDEPDDPDELPGLVARADGPLDVYEAPDAPAPSHTLPATTTFGSARALLVVQVGQDEADGWVEVQVPVRPNGTTGWIRTDDVELREVTVAVTVDLEARELVVTQDGEEVLSTPVAIGDADHPTPTGRFYVTDKLDTGAPNGPYGPFALGLAAWSDVLTEFAGGDGQVGIHGTNAPSSIGQAASHGCVRVPNDVALKLAELVPLGTPVTIS